MSRLNFNVSKKKNGLQKNNFSRRLPYPLLGLPQCQTLMPYPWYPSPWRIAPCQAQRASRLPGWPPVFQLVHWSARCAYWCECSQAGTRYSQMRPMWSGGWWRQQWAVPQTNKVPFTRWLPFQLIWLKLCKIPQIPELPELLSENLRLFCDPMYFWVVEQSCLISH